MCCCGRERLTGNRTYYVRTDGNDSNDGLADAANRAFLTIQKAIDVVSADIDPGPYDVTIQVGDGTYTQPLELKPYLGNNPANYALLGKVILKGNTANPANTIISAIGANAIRAGACGFWLLQDLTLQTTTSGFGLVVSGPAMVRISNIRFGATANSHIIATNQGFLQISGNYAIVGSAQAHLKCQNSARIQVDGITITLTGTPAFSEEFALVTHVGNTQFNGTIFSGSATGVRYLVQANGVLDSGGGGTSYLPGNAAGSTATGGQYL